jgi:hypothetical protein
LESSYRTQHVLFGISTYCWLVAVALLGLLPI